MNEYEPMSRLKTTRQKKRLVKEDFKKKLLKLDKERRKLWKEKHEIDWVELDEPYQKGYKRFFILREDVARSSRADFFESLLRKINTIQYSDNRKFLKRKRKDRKKIWVEKEQNLRAICECAWNSNKMKLTEEEKCYFVRKEKYHAASKSKKISYVFIEPWRYVLKIIPHIITHYKPIDTELESKIKQIDNYLARNFLNDKLYKMKAGNLNKWNWHKPDPDREGKKGFLKIKKEKQWEVK